MNGIRIILLYAAKVLANSSGVKLYNGELERYIALKVTIKNHVKAMFRHHNYLL
jgi:hypothetical protein